MSGIMSMLLGARTAIAVAVDEFFNRVTLLLPGDGTNGAQNNTFLDSSTNNFTITRNGNTTQGTFSPFSQTGWSNYFRGGANTDAVNTSSAVALTGDFALECWIYQAAAATTYTVFAGHGSGTTQFVIDQTSGGASTGAVSFYQGSWIASSSAGVFTRNVWNHVALTRSGTTVRIFVNGSQVASGTLSGTVNFSNFGSIGANYTLNGYISNLRITSGAALYTSTFTPSTTPLTTSAGAGTVVLLTCQANRFVDASATQTMTVTSVPSVEAFSPFAPTAAYSADTVGGSGYFDGTGDYLFTSSNTALVLNTGSWTIEAWAFCTGGSGYRSVLSKRTGANAEYEMGIDNSGYFYLYIGTTVYATTTLVPLNSWNHLCITCDGTNIRMFQNGVLTRYNASLAAGNGTGNLSTGVEAGTAAQNWIGYISNERIVKGSVVSAYSTSSTTEGTVIFTPPTIPLTAITNTSYLLNFTNAGITDATAKNDLETVGNAQISTTQSKFGGSSIAFDGTGDYLVIPKRPFFDFPGDFTIEFWLYANSLASYGFLMDTRSSASTFWLMDLSTSGVIGWGPDATIRISSSSISTGQWYHVAVARSGSSTKMFLNGTQTGSTYTSSASITAGTTNVVVGGSALNPGSFNVNCYIDDLRITVGHARYTSNFTAPTSAFALQ
jgi:hypothetical protein